MRIERPFRTGFVATLGALTAIVLAVILGSLGTVLTLVGAALFLAFGFEPIIARLERVGWPRWVAMTSTILATAGLIAIVTAMIVPSVAEQSNELVARYSTLVNAILASDVIDWATKTFPAIDVHQVITEGTNWLRDNIQTIGGGVLQIAFGVVSALTSTIIVAILTLYFVGSMHSLKRGFYQLAPASKRARVAEITEEITGSVGRYVVGQLTLGLINGVCTFLLLSFLGASLPAVFAVIAFVGSLIPLVGTLSASVVIVLMQLLMGHTDSNVWWIAAIYYVVYMQIEAYVISPRIMSSAVKLPGAVVVIAALVGGSLLGLFGAVIAIPVAAAVQLIVKEVAIPAQNER